MVVMTSPWLARLELALHGTARAVVHRAQPLWLREIARLAEEGKVAALVGERLQGIIDSLAKRRSPSDRGDAVSLITKVKEESSS